MSVQRYHFRTSNKPVCLADFSSGTDLQWSLFFRVDVKRRTPACNLFQWLSMAVVWRWYWTHLFFVNFSSNFWEAVEALETRECSAQSALHMGWKTSTVILPTRLHLAMRGFSSKTLVAAMTWAFRQRTDGPQVQRRNSVSADIEAEIAKIDEDFSLGSASGCWGHLEIFLRSS